MSSCACKIAFKSVQVCGGCCKLFRGLTFLGHSVSIYLFNMVTEQRLRFFAHMKIEDHRHAIAGAIRKHPSDWKRPPGRPNHTWLRAIESDLRPLNAGPSYAWKKAACREHWRSIVDTATLKKSIANATKKKEEGGGEAWASAHRGKWGQLTP